jgi:hypothetical protein
MYIVPVKAWTSRYGWAPGNLRLNPITSELANRSASAHERDPQQGAAANTYKVAGRTKSSQ